MWRRDTKPTRSNIRKRLDAADAALKAAQDLIVQNKPFGLINDTDNARAWITLALMKLDENKGKRK